ncbi:MAG: DUF4430 domain-containing protein [Ruminococcus sp.]|jgi:hypothetical protein|nr:DUF4430 domain-containing protein [Ruminococcus sp.]
MKKTIIISAIGASFLAMSIPFSASCADNAQSVTLRIEGINDCLYYGSYTLPDSSAKYTVSDVISGIDKENDSITVTGLENNYITAVNSDKAGKFGGYDGWLYRVNNTEPNVGVNAYDVKPGDNVVLYYGDPFGVGMQYPTADCSEIGNGILTFTSSDAVYDANYNVSYKINPVEKMNVTWTSGDQKVTLTTDSQGKVKVPAEMLSVGSHAVSVSKVSEAGIPLVLRQAPDYQVNVAEITTSETTQATTETTTAETTAISETTETTTTTADAAATSTTAKTTVKASTTTAKSASTSSPKTGDAAPLAGLAGFVALLTMFAARKKN